MVSIILKGHLRYHDTWKWQNSRGNDMPGVDKGCVTHWAACDCREQRFEAMEGALRLLLQAQGEIHPGWNNEYLLAEWVRETACAALAPPQEVF